MRINKITNLKKYNLSLIFSYLEWDCYEKITEKLSNRGLFNLYIKALNR